MSILLRVHEVEREGFKEIVVALCDEELLGKTLDNDFFVNPRFYGGESLGDEAIRFVLGASIVNAVGNQSVGLLVSNGLVKKEDIIRIGGISHAQIVVIEN